jgi:hypothetical protein
MLTVRGFSRTSGDVSRVHAQADDRIIDFLDCTRLARYYGDRKVRGQSIIRSPLDIAVVGRRESSGRGRVVIKGIVKQWPLIGG